MLREQYVGVAVKVIRADIRAMHAGLLYAHSDGEIRFAHLAFHHDLRNDPAPVAQGYFWSICEWLSDPEMKDSAQFVANYIESVVRNSAVNYGFDPAGVGFDPSGQFYCLDPAKGLTCATFISAVFQSVGFPIVNLSAWPIREGDVAWRDYVLEMLTLNGRQDRAKELENEEVSFRLTPAEAAVAASAKTVPVTYETVVQLAAPLLRDLFVEVSA